jgi:hypothetical protein
MLTVSGVLTEWAATGLFDGLWAIVSGRVP